MLKTFARAVSLMALFLVSTSASAAEPRTRLIKTIFYSETGEKTEFNATEGGAIRVTHQATNREYRLVPEFIGEAVQFKIYDVGSGKLLDTLAMPSTGVIKNSIVVPFSLSVEGIEESAEQTPSPLSGGEPVLMGASCCLACGGYAVCCEPRKGYCCTISSSCGRACRVCN